MRRISSGMTFFYKRIFPIIFVGFFVLITASAFFAGWSAGRSPPLPFLIIPAIMLAFFFFIAKKLIFDLVDEVLDAGDALIVRNVGQEERIALSEIMNVNYTALVNPPRVTLSLRRPSIFGTQVAFCAPVRFVPFSTSPIIDELIQRIDATRRR